MINNHIPIISRLYPAYIPIKSPSLLCKIIYVYIYTHTHFGRGQNKCVETWNHAPAKHRFFDDLCSRMCENHQNWRVWHKNVGKNRRVELKMCEARKFVFFEPTKMRLTPTKKCQAWKLVISWLDIEDQSHVVSSDLWWTTRELGSSRLSTTSLWNYAWMCISDCRWFIACISNSDPIQIWLFRCFCRRIFHAPTKVAVGVRWGWGSNIHVHVHTFLTSHNGHIPCLTRLHATLWVRGGRLGWEDGHGLQTDHGLRRCAAARCVLGTKMLQGFTNPTKTIKNPWCNYNL